MAGIANFIIPIMAVLIAALIIAFMYLWWSGSLSEVDESGSTDSPSAHDLSMNSESLALLGDQVVFGVLRNPADSVLSVQIGGQQYRRLSDMPQDQREYFLANVAALDSFIQQAEASTAAPQPQPTPKQTKKKPPEDTEGDEDDAAPETIAQQINTLLQERLTVTPTLASRSISITDAEDGGVLIHVDDETFDGLGEVTDPSIRVLLQRVIQDWENSQSLTG